VEDRKEMNVKELEIKARRDFNNAICLIGLIPFGVFVYLLVSRAGSLNALSGETGYILLITMVLLLLGIVTGRRMLWAVVNRLFAYSEQVVDLQGELIEKNRLAAVTETTLALSHEINNPLLIMRGNLELLEDDIVEASISDIIRQRFDKIKNHCERIRRITDKLTKISKPVTTTIYGDAKMIDAERS